MIKRYLARRNNPWELLVIALLVFVPGLIMLFQREPMTGFAAPTNKGRAILEILSPEAAHIFGWIAVAVAVFLVGLYFYTRVSIARDEKAPPPHFLDL